MHTQEFKSGTWSISEEENNIIKLWSPPHFSTKAHPSICLSFSPLSLFALEVEEWVSAGGARGGVCRALMLVGAHSTGQYMVLHLVPRLCINSTPVTIYSSRPSSIWCTEQGTKRVLLPSHQSEANLLQCITNRAERGGGGAMVWEFWHNVV